MPIAYAPRPIWIPSEADAGVVFHQNRVLSNGSIAPARYWRHDAGRWESMFDPARHVRRLARALSAVARSPQCFAVPAAVAADPAASATIFALDDAGSPRSVLDVLGATDLAASALSSVGFAT